MFDKRVQIFQREDSRVWWCATRINGKRFRQSTKEIDLDQAKDVAEEWYLDLRGKRRNGEILKEEMTFGEAYTAYLAEAKVLTVGTRSPKYIEGLEIRMRRHILPYFGRRPLSSITKGLINSYRAFRAEDTITRTTVPAKDGLPARPGKPPARSTMLSEICHIRQVLKFAEGNGWLAFVPSLQAAHMSQTKKGRRAWFSPEEYEQLYKATRRKVEEGQRHGWTSRYEDLHDYVLFMANTGLRPDEAKNLQMRDVKIEKDYGTKSTILEIDVVRGKVGSGYCKSTPQAVFPFERLRKRRLLELRLEEFGFGAIQKKYPHLDRAEIMARFASEIEAIDEKGLLKRLSSMKVFPIFPRELFRAILIEENLRYDRDGNRRTAYSLRHTYICNRLMEGAPIHMVANNCRTSPQMIDEHYAAHIKDRIDASLLNVMRPKPARTASRKARSDGDNSAYI